MRILITGGKGQLGADCRHVLSEAHDVLAVDIEELDITDRSSVERMVRDVTPDLILNCAAYTQVDACETERQSAWNINVEGPRNLAASARQHGRQIIHISTDYVFDGRKRVPEPYVEDDATVPLSYYGQTKLEGEIAVRDTAGPHMIVRTAWLYGANGHNILKTFLKLALGEPEKPLSVVNDQFGSPTWSYRLARQIARLIEAGGQGTYHATSEGYCTWYELACYFLGRMNVAHNVVPCSTEAYPRPAARPKNSILENRRLKQQGLNLMPFWKNDIDQFVSMFRERLTEEVSRIG